MNLFEMLAKGLGAVWEALASAETTDGCAELDTECPSGFQDNDVLDTCEKN